MIKSLLFASSLSVGAFVTFSSSLSSALEISLVLVSCSKTMHSSFTFESSESATTSGICTSQSDSRARVANFSLSEG
ncbi:hypothetical protein HanRHA438_Chr09g0398191 [Helianthus annuus]|nr:hypothetical protein HanRHA438_Chr09g0398191 [Helianthus annuus]